MCRKQKKSFFGFYSVCKYSFVRISIFFIFLFFYTFERVLRAATEVAKKKSS